MQTQIVGHQLEAGTHHTHRQPRCNQGDLNKVQTVKGLVRVSHLLQQFCLRISLSLVVFADELSVSV